METHRLVSSSFGGGGDRGDDCSSKTEEGTELISFYICTFVHLYNCTLVLFMIGFKGKLLPYSCDHIEKN